MDFIYSIGLLISFASGLTALVCVAMPRAWHANVPLLFPAGVVSFAIATIAFVVSVLVHRHWGHGPESVEPLSLAGFASAHPAFALAALLLIAAALVIVLSSNKPGGSE